MKLVSKHFDNHFHEGFKIEEIGIRLSKESVSQINKKLRELILRTPSTSFTTLTLKKRHNKVIGTIDVNGFGQSFTSTHIGNDSLKVYSLLEKKIKNQISKWKKNRFTPKSFSNPFFQKEVAI